MGVKELREAFNAVAGPGFSASRALLSTERNENGEWSRLTFSGIGPDGTPFEVQSELVEPGADVLLVTTQIAQNFLAAQAPSPAPPVPEAPLALPPPEPPAEEPPP